MKRLPNVLACSRIALSGMLPFLLDKPVLFVIVYFLCGIIDIMDVYLARVWGAETALGTKLDSLGDFIFYAVWLYVLFTFGKADNSQIIICVTIVAIIRIANLVITRVKFRQWNVMHTIGNKLTGLVLFLMLPVCMYASNIAFWSVIVTGAIAALSALEESIILIKTKCYDANRRSAFFIGIVTLDSRKRQGG
jgi:CDP-diacylglycerol--glycerol-3-phosphate 3-phosphatidyltransferase